jgi:hypothetical protein
MSTKFYNFLKTANAFTGSETKEHNTLFSYSTLFALQNCSIINYKMIKIQFRFLLILLHNLLLKNNDLIITNFDRKYHSIFNLSQFGTARLYNTAEKWFFSSSSNYPIVCLTKRYLYQQLFSALLKFSIILNIGSVEHFRLNHFSMKRRLLLFSTLNTNGKITDYQYYFTVNTYSYLMMLFVMHFFFDVFKKYTYSSMLYSHHNLLRYRYWVGVYHVYNKHYIRRAILLLGLLTRGLLFFCFQKLYKSYRRIALFNFYCSNSNASVNQNFTNSLLSIFNMELNHDSRFLKKERYRTFRKSSFKKTIKHYFFGVRKRSLHYYFMELSRRRLRVKRFICLVPTKYTQFATLLKRTNWLNFHSERFFLGVPITEYRKYRQSDNYIYLQDKFRPFRRFREFTRSSYIRVFFKKIVKQRRREFFLRRRLLRCHAKRYFMRNVWYNYRKRYQVYLNFWPELEIHKSAYPYFYAYYKKIFWFNKKKDFKNLFKKSATHTFNYKYAWLKYAACYLGLSFFFDHRHFFFKLKTYNKKYEKTFNKIK